MEKMATAKDKSRADWQAYKRCSDSRNILSKDKGLYDMKEQV